MKSNSIHLIEENVEMYFCDLRVEEAVLKTRKTQNVKRKMKLAPFKKLKGFCSTKYITGKVNRKVTAGEERFVMSNTNRGLFSILVHKLLGLRTSLLLEITEGHKEQKHSHTAL